MIINFALTVLFLECWGGLSHTWQTVGNSCCLQYQCKFLKWTPVLKAVNRWQHYDVFWVKSAWRLSLGGNFQFDICKHEWSLFVYCSRSQKLVSDLQNYYFPAFKVFFFFLQNKVDKFIKWIRYLPKNLNMKIAVSELESSFQSYTRSRMGC